MVQNRTENLLRGAAVAAFLILPTAGQTVPRAMAAESTGDWVSMPPRSFAVHELKLDNLVATVTVSVADGPVTLQLSGNKDRLQNLTIRQEGDTLRVYGKKVHEVWNWHDWFDFSHTTSRNPESLQVHLNVPRGTPLTVDGLVGNARIGDTMGPLNLEVVSSHTTVGRVGGAKLSLAGSGQIDAAEINGPLKIEVAGSGRINVGRSDAVNADLAGAGDAHFGDIRGGLKLDIAGSGSATANSVNGPVKVDIAGSGSVKIASGEANPLHLDIMGSGNFDFGGMAVDPHLSAMGSGSVRLKSYTGHLSTDGSVHLTVNGQDIHPSGDNDDND